MTLGFVITVNKNVFVKNAQVFKKLKNLKNKIKKYKKRKKYLLKLFNQIQKKIIPLKNLLSTFKIQSN